MGTLLTYRATGAKVTVEDDQVERWVARGYVAADAPEPDPEPEQAPAQDATPEPEPPPESEPVPEGSTAEILRWVGEDRDRAQAALDREQDEDRPRKGLTGELRRILDEE